MSDQKQTKALLPCPACGAMSDGEGIPVRRDEIERLRGAIRQALASLRLRGPDDSLLEAVGRASIILCGIAQEALNPAKAEPEETYRARHAAKEKHIAERGGDQEVTDDANGH